VDRLEQAPARVALIFNYDAAAAIHSPENAELLRAPTTKDVLRTFAELLTAQGSEALTAERFKALVNEVKRQTGVKGRELFHPIRIFLTGAPSGPEFDKIVPLIEEGSRLKLPRRVLSVRERVEAFQAAQCGASQK
jgi:glutamyl-tRNA synthetase/nondiscriminating glutamyl-tRNA synthetase